MKTIVKIILIFALAFVPELANARQCSACGGSGRKYVPGMGTYGVSNKKSKCARCGQLVSAGSGHSCKCPTCGGTGQVGGRERDRGGDVNEMDMDAKIYLTTDEYNAYTRLFQQLVEQVVEYPKCQACGGSGICHVCKGASSFDYPCVACGGGHMCLSCRGVGTGAPVYRQKTDAERAPIINMIRSFNQTIQQRKRQRNGGR